MRIVASLLLVVAVAGCGGHASPSRDPISASEWKAVLRDWQTHGAIAAGHPCAAILIAQTHLPSSPPRYSTVELDLRRAERHACPAGEHPERLRTGMSDADAAERAGLPGRVGPHCWLYRTTTEHRGARVCFAEGRIATIGFTTHG